jgi:hypothetical protein
VPNDKTNDNDMKKSALALALAFALAIAPLGAAQAQTYVPVEDLAARPLRFVLGAGLTYGGDKIATAFYDDDIEFNIKGGDSVALLAGLDYRFNPQFSVQGTVGYHVDQARARNGHMRFDRVPLELLGYYHVSEKVRVGGGLRYVTNVSFSSSGASDVGDFDFSDSTGAVAEIEYAYSPRVGFKLRYANDRFEEKISRLPLKGEHVGLLVNVYF